MSNTDRTFNRTFEYIKTVCETAKLLLSRVKAADEQWRGGGDRYIYLYHTEAKCHIIVNRRHE